MSLALLIALSLGQAPAAALSLGEAYQQAQAKNADLKVARLRFQQAQLNLQKVWTHQLPQVEAYGTYARNSSEVSFQIPSGYYVRTVGSTALNGPAYDPSRPISTSNPPGTASNTIIVPSGYNKTTLLKENQLGAAVTLTVPLLVPELWPKFHEAELGEDLAKERVEQARRDVLFAVAELYYQAAALKEGVLVQERILENVLAHERDAQARVRAGALAHIGLVRAQLDRTRTEQDLLRARNSYAAARSALASLLGREDDFEVGRPEEPTIPESSADLDTVAMAQRPDLEVARRQVRLSEASARSVPYKYAPSVAATALLLTSNGDLFAANHGMWSASVLMKWTLWDGGQREVELKEARLKALEANATVDASVARVHDEVRRAKLDLTSARANRLKAQEQLSLARENESIITKNFSAGAASPVDLSDATTALSNAETSVVAESLNAQLAALRLLRATGAFSPGTP